MPSDSDPSDNDLHTAVRYGDVKEVKQALLCRLSPNKIGLYKWSPLHEASSNGYTDIVKLLLQHGGDPNLADRLGGNTAVHYAAQEGHQTCLGLLLAAGGDCERANDDGETAAETATRACLRIIEKQRVEKLMKMGKTEAKLDAAKDLVRPRREKVVTAPGRITEERRAALTSMETVERSRAWNAPVTDTAAGALGQLQLSFEYHCKKRSLKIRLWRLTGLLMSPERSAMIGTLYVKSSIVPDPKRQSKRRSEEIKVQPLLAAQSKKGNVQPYVTETGLEVLFQPVVFKFSKALVYEDLPEEAVKSKALLIQVNVKQRYTQRKFQLADLTIPLDVAVTKIVRESFPLSACGQTSLPETMTVLPEIKNNVTSISDPNIRVGISPAPSRNIRPASDLNLQEVISTSSYSPSVSIEMPVDEEQPEIHSVRVDRDKPAEQSITVQLNAENSLHQGVDAEHTELPSVISAEPTGEERLDMDVRITVTNADSDSSELEGTSVHPDTMLSRLKKRVTPRSQARRSDDVINLMEMGSHSRQDMTSAPRRSSLTKLTEISGLKPKPSSSGPDKRVERTRGVINNHSTSKSLRGSDISVSVDLELEDLEYLPTAHQSKQPASSDCPV